MNDWLEGHRTLVLSIISLLIVAGLAAVWLRWKEPAPITILPPAPTATPGPIRVYVSGAVTSPDVYSIPPGSIMRDALNAAGGASGEADLNQVNLAQVLRDGDHVYVPKIGEVPTPALVGVDSTEAALSGLLNINTATAEQLEALPGIGPAIAKRIVDYRDAHGPFANIEAIQNVSGIGPTIFGQIKDLITVN